jgi:molybdopterin molybdotransferase
MLSVAEASAIIRGALPAVRTESVSLAEALGRVLQQTVQAERDQPPYDRVTMDGIALRFSAFANGRRTFGIAGTQHAGDPVQRLPDSELCIEVMTGAVLPEGCDCVIPVERIVKDNGKVTIAADYTAEPRQFIHPRGSDHGKGHELLTPGRRISAIDIALLATAGLAEVRVAALPTVRVISTGNELVAAGQPIDAHQVRMSNGPALVAMLEQQGFRDSLHLHLADDPAELRARIGEQLEASDVLVLSGGVSMGQADFVPLVLAELGVQKKFHRISQRPGKPMWFGSGPRGQLVFALPGNPVSALTCCRHYVLPALLSAMGAAPRAAESVPLAADWQFKPELTCFLPVILQTDDSGQRLATPVATNTSGDFTALADTDGYLELAADISHFAAGSAQPFYSWTRC